MGLDMYLKARKFVSNWDFREEDKPVNQAIREAVGLGHRDDEDATVEISIGVGYWRKANQIHKWFVDNVQDGRDDCGTYYVDRDKLRELRDVCREVLADHSKAKTLLPTRDGFFFGGTDYDEYYYDALTYTADQIDKLLDPKYDHFDFEYHSSW